MHTDKRRSKTIQFGLLLSVCICVHLWLLTMADSLIVFSILPLSV
jgi:hypothetical protein